MPRQLRGDLLRHALIAYQLHRVNAAPLGEGAQLGGVSEHLDERHHGGDDTVVVGISRDSTWSHKAWKKERGITHDLLADPMLEVTRQYGLEHPAVPFISHRATVIVDKQGKVAFVQVQENTPEERNWTMVTLAINNLR